MRCAGPPRVLLAPAFARSPAIARLGLTAAQAHDGQIAGTLLDHLGPRTIVFADKAYDADHVPALIELFFSKLKHFRRVAIRYDKPRRQIPRHGPIRLNATLASRF